jgi:hypothetical protein
MATRPSSRLPLLARFWFPLALLALLILAIPGLVLFALHLTGGEAPFNTWLQDRFQLTYHISLTWWLTLILLLVPVAIVLLYFLKLKRKPLSVPSTFLWRKSIEDLHVNALFQWLRQNLLLLLQLLAILVLIYAVMDFRVHGYSKEGKHYILMIDDSASMGAADVSPSRLHWAKQEALKEIDAATDRDYGMVIVFNSSAEILQSYTNNRGQLRSAVEKIEQTQRTTRIEEALSLADSLANPNRSADDASVRPAIMEPGKERTYVAAEGIKDTEVHIFSDGRFPDMPEFSLGNLIIHFHTAGKIEREEVTPALLKIAGQSSTGKVTVGPVMVNNVALAAFNAARDEDDPSKLQVFARVLNFRKDPVSTKVELDVQVKGQTTAVYERKLELPARQLKIEKTSAPVLPGAADKPDSAAAPEEFVLQTVPSEAAVTFDLTDIDDRANVVLHAKLAGIHDHFPVDDEAWLVVGVVRKARVLLVGKPNEALDAFFADAATAKVATITRLAPEDLSKDSYRRPARNGDYDLVVFDRCAPANEEDMPRGDTFFIGQPPPPWSLNKLEKISNPQIKGWMGKHPILRYLAALQEIGVAEAFKVPDIPERSRLIEIDQKNALLFSRGRESFLDLVLTFPIITDKGEWNTNWPLLPSFPLFLRNVLYTLGNISDGTGEELLQPGQVKALRPDVNASEIEVTDPEGKVQKLHRGSRADFSYGTTDHVGVYRVAWGGEWQRSFAVNLLDADESNIEPRTAVHIGAEQVVGDQERRQPRELWKWLVLLALGLLLAEWYIYNRRVYV